MKKFICAIFVMTLFCVAGAAQNARRAKLVEYLTQLKREWGKIYVSRDRAALEKMLAREYGVTGDDGVKTSREELLANFERGETIYESTSYDDVSVKIYGSVAIISGRGTVKGRRKNVPFHTQYFSTNVFVKRDGRWQAVATHISGSKEL